MENKDETNRIDNKIYSRIIRALQEEASKSDDEKIKEHILEICAGIKEVFQNYDEYEYEIVEYKQVGGLKSTKEAQGYDKLIKQTIESELNQLYGEAKEGKEQSQILDRIVGLTRLLDNYEEEISLIRKLAERNKKHRENIDEER